MLLLDTCILVWLDTAPASISDAAVQAISQHSGELFVSSMSAFELGVKCNKGKLTLPLPLEQWFAQVLSGHGIREVAADWRVCARAARLAPVHSDPFDRLIVATAQTNGLSIITPDLLIRAYPHTAVIW